MRTLMSTTRLLIIPLGCLAGCAGIDGVSSKMQTVASVGDKKLPVVSGEPGSSVAAEPVAPERKTRSDGRISGRVVDANGDPMPDVRIRLGVGKAAGGKVVKATTDPSGAFTLRGLRPGSRYTVIAEWEDEQGVMTGRSVTKAPDTDVQIKLVSSDSGTVPDAATASSSSSSTRVSQVSRPGREDSDERGVRDDDRSLTRIKEDDLPPAAEADELPRTTTTRRDRTKLVDDVSSLPRTGWQRSGSDSPAVMPSSTSSRVVEQDAAEGRETGSIDAEARGSVVPAGLPAVDDDGPNPLPPALEPGQTSHHRPKPTTPAPVMAKAEPVPADLPAPLPAEPVVQTTPARPAAEMAMAIVTPMPSDLPPPLPAEAMVETTPVERAPEPVATPAALEPIAQAPVEPLPSGFPTDADSAAPTVAEVSTEPPAGFPAEVAEASPTVLPAQSTEPVQPTPDSPSANPSSLAELPPASSQVAFEPPPATVPTVSDRVAAMRSRSASSRPSNSWPEPSETRRRPTWREVAILTEPSPPVDVAAGRPQVAPRPVDDGKAYCHYDSRYRRIDDFRLPDLNGKPIRFQELDADLVLLDFWGTWCQPCVQSIPHLVDLQNRYGSPKLKVLGIACEQGDSKDRAAKVAKEAKRLGINYQLLLSGMDGDCPLQQALHIQAYPTLILVDRQGRIVWRDQGATPTTLARLDRFLASANQPDATRRF